MATKAAVRARPATVGALIDQLWATREVKRDIESQLKEVEARIAELNTELMERMEQEGLDKASGTKATISVSTNTVAAVEDWDEFWKYILKNKYTHLLQRRVSDPAYRELLEAGKKVPGVQPFVKRSLNVRSI
jgi:hypothetical protein